MPKLEASHPYERRVKLLQEYIDEKIAMYRDYLRIEGRPAFYQKLTPEQELALYLDPAARQRISQQKMAVDGPESHAEWVARMEGRIATMRQGGNNADSR